MTLNAPLEQLAQSDVRLQLLAKKNIQNLKVAMGQVGKSSCIRGYNVGPDQGTLDFAYEPGKTLGGSPLAEMMTFSDLGFTLIALKSGDIYAIHRNSETLPNDLPYQEVSRMDYLTRVRQLGGE